MCCIQANISTLAGATETACAGHQTNESQYWWICNTRGAQPSMGRWDRHNCVCISACKSKCKNAVTQECSCQKPRAVWCVRRHCKSCCLLQQCRRAVSECSMQQLGIQLKRATSLQWNRFLASCCVLHCLLHGNTAADGSRCCSAGCGQRFSCWCASWLQQLPRNMPCMGSRNCQDCFLDSWHESHVSLQCDRQHCWHIVCLQDTS